MSKSVRNIVEETFGYHRTKMLWAAGYSIAIPLAPATFDVGAILPAILYMARWGHRRGVGGFVKTFGREEEGKRQPPTIADVRKGLLLSRGNMPKGCLKGFDDAEGHLVLADLLLAWCLENKRHALGHGEQVQRAFPTHYLSSWIDLPKSLQDLRWAPELIIVLLADQKKGEWIDSASNNHGRYPVEAGFTDNPLLALFGRHMMVRGDHLADRGAADHFLEAEADDLGIDELLAVRLAQACGYAPDKVRARSKDETERIPNQKPLATLVSRHLREDLTTFIEVYGGVVPRQAFLQMFEAGVALGFTTILVSTATMLLSWEETGFLPEQAGQQPWPLFVDASHGQDNELRSLSEASSAEMARRYERLPVITMLLRVLEDQLDGLELQDPPPRSPDATARINLLGDLLHERHEESIELHKILRGDCRRLADALDAEGESPEIVDKLRGKNIPSPVRLAEALVELMGRHSQQVNYLSILESCLMTDRPNGLAIKRKARRTNLSGRRSTDVLRAFVLTPTMLDFLVHRHLRKASRGRPQRFLSLRNFLDLLRERYGLYVDREPPGLPVSQALLQRNKAALERRLRDLGLLVGVNDAESMKQLKARYHAAYEQEADHADV